MTDKAKSHAFLKKAWQFMEREEAEKILLAKGVGTYLFRKDHFASCLEKILSGAKKASIECYTLAYLDATHAVREKTVVSWDGKWLFYDDDPSLTEKSYSSLKNLLGSLGSTLKMPL
jgi:hypothetical protein